MSWYVIEGPDNVGKTTLARGLQRRGWRYEHADGRDSLPTFAERLSLLAERENVVLDRAHLGEMVHGPLDRKTTWSMGWFRLIEAFLLEKHARGILLTNRQGPAVEWENDRRRHELLTRLFQGAANLSFLSWTGWPDPMPITTHLDENGVEWEDRPDVEGLGGMVNNRPEVWILAQQQNPKATVAWPLATRCGLDLVWPTINPRIVRISNAYPSDWRPVVEQANPYRDLHVRWEELYKPPVIVLGQAAREACVHADVPVETALPHPQWHLRFRSQEPEVYQYHLGMAILNLQREHA